MSTIRLENLTHRFGEFLALDNVSLEIQDRNVVTIVGPSGCGKSTLLRIIAGLERPSSGTISIDGQVVNTVPTRFRNVAMVDRKSTRLNSSHIPLSRMPSSA